MIAPERRQELAEHLRFIYGDAGEAVLPRLLETLEAFQPQRQRVAPPDRLSERDAILITYGDQVRQAGETPLTTLGKLLTTRLTGTVTGVHLLPFNPYSSDDGFSVIDYRQVDPALGGWDDITRLGRSHRLMFDAVVNHVSASHAWFQGFLEDRAPYRDYFLTPDPATDLSKIVRPRTSPLLTPVDTATGTKHVWTTFSADQIDLDYHNPAVMLEVLEVLLYYVEQGAEIIRLDAVTYLWKEVGHSGVHHPNTHRLLKLYRSALEAVAPWVVLLTETNVPHAENVSYFGSGLDEAQMVYNFALPPLTLHSFLAGDAGKLTAWARNLSTPSGETTFFNFLASHDGIGVRPVEGILSRAEIDELVATAHRHGGGVSSKTNSDGSESPYELNINYFDALNDPHGNDPLELQVRRFISAQALMMALPGVPGIYVHSLLGSRSARHEVEKTGRKRSINREKFELGRLEREFDDPQGLRHQVLTGFRALLRIRTSLPAFHPQAPHRVLDTPASLFGVARQGSDGRAVYCLTNVTGERVALPPGLLPDGAVDLLGGGRDGEGVGWLDGYGTRWLQE